MNKKYSKGFTLIELMAVIIIISLIALLTFPNIVNQINKTKKSNNKMIEDVLITQAKKYVSDNKDDLIEDEYCMPISTLIDNNYIKAGINDIKDNKVIHINLKNNALYEVVDKDKCIIIPVAVKYLLKKTNPNTITNYTDGDIHEMYTFEHVATIQTPALTDYRYIGSDPKNYVEFNNELWRIIGVFTVEDENGKSEERIKIVRNEKLSNNMPWDSNNINEWATASLNTYLNGEYYNELDVTSQSMIANTKYYLGGSNSSSAAAEGYYEFERGTTVYSGRNTYWIGKISLMYSSDYIYNYALGVDSTCYNSGYNCTSMPGKAKGWIYNSNNNSTQWLLQHRSGYSSVVFYIHSNGGIGNSSGAVSLSYGVRPTLYLSSKVKITSGDGSIDNAYKLSM